MTWRTILATLEAMKTFKPARLTVGVWCLIVLALILADISFLRDKNGFIFYFSLALLSTAFLILSVPFLKNQKITVTNSGIQISSFGKVSDLTFYEDLNEVVVKNSEIVSYRFEKSGKHYQISPHAYHEADELERIFSNLYKSLTRRISIVQR